ncbi:MAG: TRAP transporter substrate-binding protein [Treponema sp.]|jgi:tripartite ATP-independent transporter DctP family solute receptor|nr:TRAP transporter substrate-binding protein [Treponema sp.]
MKKSRGLIGVLAVSGLVFYAGIMGCSNSSGSGGGGVSAGAASAAAPIIMKAACTNPPDSYQTNALRDISNIVKEKTTGAIDIQVFPASQLGEQRDYLEGLRMGTLEIALVGTGFLEGFESRFCIFDIPFVFENHDHMFRFLASDICQKLLDDFRTEQGFRHLLLADEGLRHVWTTNVEIKSLQDFKKLNIRVPEIPLYVNMFKTLGANPVPLGLGDVYTGLQTGIINAFENGVENVVTIKLDELLKVNNVSNHVYSLISVLTSEKVFASLSKEHQDILVAAGKEAEKNVFTVFDKLEKERYATLASRGIKTVEFPPQLMDQIRDTVKNVSRELLKGLYDYDEVIKLALSLR